MRQLLPIASIRRDGGTQLRLRTDLATVERYREVLTDPDDKKPPEQRLAPITVFHDGTDFWLSDGFHTLQAAEEVGLTEFMANVYDGGRQDAMMYAASANSKHGLPRNKGDRYNAIAAIIHEFPDASDDWVARTCRVRQGTVQTVRKTMFAPVPVSEAPARRVPAGPSAAEQLAGLSEQEKIAAIQADEESEAERTITCSTCGGTGVCKCRGTGKCTRCLGIGKVVC